MSDEPGESGVETGGKDGDPKTTTGNEEALSGPVPLLKWADLRHHFEYKGEKDENNIFATCKKCRQKYSAPKTSSYNLKKHLKNAHGIDVAAETRKRPGDTDSGVSDQMKRGKSQSTDSGGSSVKQSTLEECKERQSSLVTQARLDRVVIDYIVMECMPFDTVDSSYFRAAVLLGLRSGLTVMCRQTLVARLRKIFNDMKISLSDRLSKITSVCTTADCWTKHRRSFIGMTVHWVDPDTLKRCSAALAVRRLKGRHTYDVIAKAIDDIHKEFRIQNKVVKTITDNGSNFVKAFDVFKPDMDSSAEDGADEEEELIPITDILREAPEDSDIILPPHFRCSAHTLNLVATKDSQKALENIPTFTSAMKKLKKIWKKQNKSTISADEIFNTCGVYLQSPNQTRWNSTFDAIQQLVKLLKSDEQKVHALFDRTGLTRLTKEEIRCLKEYVDVSKPLANALDILQGEQYVSMGYLAPTISSLEENILEIIGNRPTNLEYCKPFAEDVLKGIRERFKCCEEKEVIVAACVHPEFKFCWLETNESRDEAIGVVRSWMLNEIPTEEERDNRNERIAMEADDSESSKFGGFFKFRARQSRSERPRSQEEVVSEELGRFMADKRTEIGDLAAYPLIKKIFIRLNSVLPSSASVERLFSLSGNVFGSRRARLADDSLEIQVLLKANREFWQ